MPGEEFEISFSDNFGQEKWKNKIKCGESGNNKKYRSTDLWSRKRKQRKHQHAGIKNKKVDRENVCILGYCPVENDDYRHAACQQDEIDNHRNTNVK